MIKWTTIKNIVSKGKMATLNTWIDTILYIREPLRKAVLVLICALLLPSSLFSQSVSAWGQLARYNNGSFTWHPFNIPGDIGQIIAVSSGEEHASLLTPVLTPKMLGDNSFGQANLPLAPNDNNLIAISAGDFHTLALKNDATVVAWGVNFNNQRLVPAELSDVISVAAGGFHSLALKADGTIVGWGDNRYGHATAPAGNHRFVAVSAGAWHNIGLKEDGTVVAWGYNNVGQTTVPAGLNNVVAISARGYNSFALLNDGTLRAWGQYLDAPPPAAATNWKPIVIPNGLSNIAAVATGTSHTLAIKSDRTLVAIGYNNKGQLDTPIGLTNLSGIAAGGFHSIVVTGNIPTIIRKQPQSKTVDAGQNVNFFVLTTGGVPISYQWLFQGQPLTGKRFSSLRLNNVTKSQEGNYSVRITNPFGTVTSSVAHLIVNSSAAAIPGAPINLRLQ